jgi:hypothetical protein
MIDGSTVTGNARLGAASHDADGVTVSVHPFDADPVSVWLIGPDMGMPA